MIMHAETPYTRVRTLKKKAFGIWTVEIQKDKSRTQLFARCGGCMKINDVTTNFFTTIIENGKASYGMSGCAACKFCTRSFNGQKFDGWRFEYSLSHGGRTTFVDDMKTLLKVFSKHKGEPFHVYGVHDPRNFDALGIMKNFFSGATVSMAMNSGGIYQLRGTMTNAYKDNTDFRSLENAVDTAVSFILNKPNPRHKS